MSGPFVLIETMRWEGEVALLGRHMARLRQSAAFFGVALDAETILSAVESAIRSEGSDSGAKKVRLTVDELGHPHVSLHGLEDLSSVPHRVAFSESRIDADDVFRRHKTSKRGVYDVEYAAALTRGLFDLVYLNERGLVAEGSRTNIFVASGGNLLTPPVVDGALPGVFRSLILETRPEAREASLSPENLSMADRLYVCNAVIGLVEVELIDSSTECDH